MIFDLNKFYYWNQNKSYCIRLIDLKWFLTIDSNWHFCCSARFSILFYHVSRIIIQISIVSKSIAVLSSIIKLSKNWLKSEDLKTYWFALFWLTTWLTNFQVYMFNLHFKIWRHINVFYSACQFFLHNDLSLLLSDPRISNS